ncbi:MAG: NYN domain-containing protein [Ignavibacteria bacterium]|nr:NYN domain-containing protein [Ignavibacteria bacterium]
METVIIDAYNLMHRVGELKILLKQSQDVCVDTLISKLESHFFRKGVKCILVFDGYGKNTHKSNIEVKFSKTDTGTDYGNADGLIKHLIEKAKSPKLVKIISSDRDVTFFAKECGCKFQTAEAFWGEVKDKRLEALKAYDEENEKPDVITKGEYEYFLKEFTKKDGK